jgi:hypothetical protein
MGSFDPRRILRRYRYMASVFFAPHVGREGSFVTAWKQTPADKFLVAAFSSFLSRAEAPWQGQEAIKIDFSQGGDISQNHPSLLSLQTS